MFHEDESPGEAGCEATTETHAGRIEGCASVGEDGVEVATGEFLTRRRGRKVHEGCPELGRTFGWGSRFRTVPEDPGRQRWKVEREAGNAKDPLRIVMMEETRQRVSTPSRPWRTGESSRMQRHGLAQAGKVS